MFEKWLFDPCPCGCEYGRVLTESDGRFIVGGLTKITAMKFIQEHNAQAPEPPSPPDPVPSPGPWFVNGPRVLSSDGAIVAGVYRYNNGVHIVSEETQNANVALILSVHDKQAVLEAFLVNVEKRALSWLDIAEQAKRALDLKNYLPKSEKE